MVVVVVVPKTSAFMLRAKVSHKTKSCQSEFSRAQIGQVADQQPGLAEKPCLAWHGDQALNVLLEKRQHALPGILGRLRVVTWPLIVEERVPRAGIDFDGNYFSRRGPGGGLSILRILSARWTARRVSGLFMSSPANCEMRSMR